MSERKKQQNQPQNDTETMTLARPKVKRPRKYAVMFHNDDYTTQEFVILVLVQYFNKSEEEALKLMLEVHTKNKAIVGVYTKDIAETKVEIATSFARKSNMPLAITAEPE